MAFEQKAHQITEKQLAENFDRICREVAEQIRKYESEWASLPAQPEAEQLIHQPYYRYEVHAVS